MKVIYLVKIFDFFGLSLSAYAFHAILIRVHLEESVCELLRLIHLDLRHEDEGVFLEILDELVGRKGDRRSLLVDIALDVRVDHSGFTFFSDFFGFLLFHGVDFYEEIIVVVLDEF